MKNLPHPGKLSEMLPADRVADAYRREHAWQYRRLQELADRIERAADALREERLMMRREREAWQEMLASFISIEDRRKLEEAIRGTCEDAERRQRRRKRYPYPGGFDPRKPFKK